MATDKIPIRKCGWYVTIMNPAGDLMSVLRRLSGFITSDCSQTQAIMSRRINATMTKVRQEQLARELRDVSETMKIGQIQKAYEHIQWIIFTLETGYPSDA